MDFDIPEPDLVVRIHEVVLEFTNGLGGIPHPEYIEAAVYRPQNYLAYTDSCSLHDVCAVLLDSLARNHAFADGNKRTALLTMIFTYRINGVSLDASLLTNEEFEELVLWVVKEEPEIPQISARLTELVERHKSSKPTLRKLLAS
jgi:death-on-curing protein